MALWPCPIKASTTFLLGRKKNGSFGQIYLEKAHLSIQVALLWLRILLLPPTTYQQLVPPIPTSVPCTCTLPPRPKFIFTANKYFLNIPKYLYLRTYISALPHMALSYPGPISVSWQDWITGAKGTVTPPGQSGPEFLDEEEHVPQNSTNILSSLPQKCHCRRQRMAKPSASWSSILSQPLPLQVHGMKEVFLYCNLNFEISWCINGNMLKLSSCCLILCLFGSVLPHCHAGHNVVINVRFIKTISGWSVLREAF